MHIQVVHFRVLHMRVNLSEKVQNDSHKPLHLTDLNKTLPEKDCVSRWACKTSTTRWNITNLRIQCMTAEMYGGFKKSDMPCRTDR